MIGAMQAHISVAAVQRAGCGALRNLASNASNRMKIGSLGGIEAVLAAMGAHRTFAAVSQSPVVAECFHVSDIICSNSQPHELVSETDSGRRPGTSSKGKGKGKGKGVLSGSTCARAVALTISWMSTHR